MRARLVTLGPNPLYHKLTLCGKRVIVALEAVVLFGQAHPIRQGLRKCG